MAVRVVFIFAVLGIVQCKLLNSCSVTKSFVDGHNEMRLKLAKGEVSGQPAASNMTFIIWDEELAKKAQNWASKNKYGHNMDRTIASKRFGVGENIYQYKTTSYSFKFDPKMAVKSWWDEYKDYHYGALSSKDFSGSKQIGHYTQMAWANTIRLGCGISQYDEDDWNSFYVVCNYGPSGNYIGETPYKSGNGASGRLVCGESKSNCKRKYGKSC